MSALLSFYRVRTDHIALQTVVRKSGMDDDKIACDCFSFNSWCDRFCSCASNCECFSFAF